MQRLPPMDADRSIHAICHQTVIGFSGKRCLEYRRLGKVQLTVAGLTGCERLRASSWLSTRGLSAYTEVRPVELDARFLSLQRLGILVHRN